MSNTANPLLPLLVEMIPASPDDQFDATILLADGTQVIGLIESADANLVSLHRLLDYDADGCRYADILRHFRTDSIVGAWWTTDS